MQAGYFSLKCSYSCLQVQTYQRFRYLTLRFLLSNSGLSPGRQFQRPFPDGIAVHIGTDKTRLPPVSSPDGQISRHAARRGSTGGKPDEIRPMILRRPEDLEGQLEALLTDAQEKQWKEMRGKPIELGALFDLSSR